MYSYYSEQGRLVVSLWLRGFQTLKESGSPRRPELIKFPYIYTFDVDLEVLRNSPQPPLPQKRQCCTKKQRLGLERNVSSTALFPRIEVPHCIHNLRMYLRGAPVCDGDFEATHVSRSLFPSCLRRFSRRLTSLPRQAK
jgi:hypothetical protein